MANMFYYCAFIIPEIVDFYVDNNVFWNIQDALDCTIFIKKKWESMAPDPYHESESTSLQGYLRVWYVIFDLK